MVDRKLRWFKKNPDDATLTPRSFVTKADRDSARKRRTAIDEQAAERQAALKAIDKPL